MWAVLIPEPFFLNLLFWYILSFISSEVAVLGCLVCPSLVFQLVVILLVLKWTTSTSLIASNSKVLSNVYCTQDLPTDSYSVAILTV